MEERRRIVEEREQSDEKEGEEMQQRKLSELSEREMGMWDDGRERREEVQFFCCASTAD